MNSVTDDIKDSNVIAIGGEKNAAITPVSQRDSRCPIFQAALHFRRERWITVRVRLFTI